MYAFLVLLHVAPGLSSNASPVPECDLSECDGHGVSLIQLQKMKHAGYNVQLTQASAEVAEFKDLRHEYKIPVLGIHRKFLGAAPVANPPNMCKADVYQPSPMEATWSLNALNWTGADHCNYMKAEDANGWIEQNEHGTHNPQFFSTVCRQGKTAQYIEPLAGILRDPRFGCQNRPTDNDLFSVDWLVFPDASILTPGSKARFYDAGGSRFGEALSMFLDTYKAHGIVFDEVYVWEFNKQGTDVYWEGVDNQTRAFWEPRLKFYDGVGVTANKTSEHNPVSRIFKSCAPQDFCAFKLDIDTPQVEHPLVQQLLDAPEETKAKLDEFFFEHHVKGAMQPWWGPNVEGTFADSYKIFGSLRNLGVRAHSWV